MAFSRNSMVAAVAGTLSLAMLTGCPNPNTPAPTPSTGASTAPTASPTTGTEPTAAPSGAPSVQPSPSDLKPTTLRGSVYDEEGAAVNNANVTIKSLNPSNPFETTVQVLNGSYVANSVPAGVQLEITASKENWTSRTRVETLLPLEANDPSGNRVDFGGTNANDQEGHAYFISDRPEVTMTEPADDADNVDPTKIVVKLTLSEALNSDNQDRFADAIRVLPLNRFATEVGATDVGAVTGGWNDAGADAAFTASGGYIIEDGVTFLDRDNVARVTWDADGRVATLEFNAAYLQSDDGEAEYQIALRSENNTPIRDAAGNNLGSGAATSLTNYTNGQWILSAFKETSLALNGVVSDYADAEARNWITTHQNSVSFEVPEDETDPTVTGVAVTGRNTIQITFSEPMAAFGGQGNEIIRNADLLDSYSFVVGEDADDIDDEEWTNTDVSATLLTAFASAGVTVAEGDPFKFTAPVTIELSENDPKVVRIIAPVGDKFISDVKAIRVRVDGSVQDPATNGVRTTNDANFVIGEF